MTQRRDTGRPQSGTAPPGTTPASGVGDHRPVSDSRDADDRDPACAASASATSLSDP